MNIESIREKAKIFLETSNGKRKINSALSKKLKNGSIVGSPRAAGEMFISVLHNEINALAATSIGGIQNGGLGSSAISALHHIKASSPFKISDHIYVIDINFIGDLSRPSMVSNKYEEISNIAALLNNGYSANKSVHGYWHGEDRWSLLKRQGANFMNNAVEKFNRQYKQKYNIISVELNDIYTG